MEDHWQHNQPNTEEWQTVMKMIIKLTLHQKCVITNVLVG